MDLGYRNLLAPDGPHLISPSDFRSPRLPRPPFVDELHRTPDSSEMEKVPPVTGKRRGGCRKACNECKQQKVRQESVCATPTCKYPTRTWACQLAPGVLALNCRSFLPMWVRRVLIRC
jgi:hypothetical protein